MKIAMLAGEVSGDRLGAGLINALRQHYPKAEFEGIGGQCMLAQGFKSLFPLEKLSVMGVSEVLFHLPELLWIRRTLLQYLTTHPPAVVIGIDAPEFNLPLERRLKAQGILTVHYVSPQVWAWRPGRLRTIAGAIDLMLALLPFETTLYHQYGIPVHYVGHPLADEIPWQSDRISARQALGLTASGSPLVALLPGSRMSEAQRLAPLFLEVIAWLRKQLPVAGVLPAATTPIYRYCATLLANRRPQLPITLVEGRAREVLTAADVALVASGTATLETLLIKRPMVVAYRVAPLTAWLASRFIRVSRFALPNLLAGKDVVPEFIQQAATVTNIGPAVLNLLTTPPNGASWLAEFEALHRHLRCNANAQAALAIANLLANPPFARRATGRG